MKLTASVNSVQLWSATSFFQLATVSRSNPIKLHNKETISQVRVPAYFVTLSLRRKQTVLWHCLEMEFIWSSRVPAYRRRVLASVQFTQSRLQWDTRSINASRSNPSLSGIW